MSYVCLIFLAFVLLNLDNSVRTVLHFALKGFWCQSELFSKAPRKELMSMQIWTPDQFNLLTSLLWCINSNRKDTQLLHLTLTMHLLNWKSLLWKGLQVLFPSVYRCWKLLHRWQSRMKQHWAVLNTGDFHGLRMVGHERRVGVWFVLVSRYLLWKDNGGLPSYQAHSFADAWDFWVIFLQCWYIFGSLLQEQSA